ncbi:copper-binding protein [Nitrospirillum amazonense]|uniref:Cu(I)/Ag(I) efflux system protein CusF n=1 Tax=Nitrospirillum amazonense TaxID=28077 RepID=A0A560JAS9_9PROT|nr:copper-binding protein [Nitrospirillum amazonense]MDG3439180.1 copper-binding protein [Nitrospirillum amazonense]TWB67609.1 Cu(I)/Ag(I) efflux system protein CusF [Nitrospirillum amazonense]
MIPKTFARAVVAALMITHAPALAAAPPQMDHDHSGKTPDKTPVGTGTVNTVDATRRTVTLTHGPITALNWPGMTMDFPVAPGIDLVGLRPGAQVMFTLGRSSAGAYWIDHVMPDDAAMPTGHGPDDHEG